MRRLSIQASGQLPLWAAGESEAVLAPQPLVDRLSSLTQLEHPKKLAQRLHAIDWGFTSEPTGYLGHDLHPYPAKFVPQIPANLIAALSLPGELVWDPFGGSGTTALEALLLGRRAASTDANPLAGMICRAKCTALLPEERQELQNLHERLAAIVDSTHAVELVDSAWEEIERHRPDIPNLEKWYAAEVVKSLCYIKDEILALHGLAARNFAMVVFSSVLIRVSFQDSETRYARRERHVTLESAMRVYCHALREAVVSHEPLERLLGYRTAIVADLDARRSPVGGAALLEPESVDLVVTSPPYANATDYHLYHRFRLFWLGFDPGDLAKNEIGSHLRHQRLHAGFDLYRMEMHSCLSEIALSLRPGRYAALVVGDSMFDGKTIDTADVLSKEATALSLEVVTTLSRPVHATKRSFIPAARRARSENILLLRKPPRDLRLRFGPPSYKMWPYEKKLQRLEIQAIIGFRPDTAAGCPTATLNCYKTDTLQKLAFTHRIEAEKAAVKWLTWQAVLENGDATNVRRKNPKYLTHGIHPYKGKFYPQLAKALLNIASVGSRSRVLDPFCGSGTVLLEAQLNGMSAAGLDMNPLAVLISKAKTAVLDDGEILLDRTLKTFGDGLRTDGSQERDLDNFESSAREEILNWFPAPVARRLGWLIPQIRRVPSAAARLVLQCLLSSTLRQVSQQEPADLRIRRRKKRLSDGPVLQLLDARIADFRERLHHFAERRSCAPAVFGHVEIREADSREASAYDGWSERPFDCVVTSPPYATALPYIDTDRLSLLVLLGMGSSARSRLESNLTGSREIRERDRMRFEEEIGAGLLERLPSRTAVRVIREVFRLNRSEEVGFRRRNMAALLLRYFSDMHRSMINVASVVRPGASLFFVIGNNRTLAGGRSVIIPSTTVLQELGDAVGWRLVNEIPITVTREAVLHSQNSITLNSVLHFQGPAASLEGFRRKTTGSEN